MKIAGLSFEKSATLYGVLMCALLMLLGPLYTAPGYSLLAHTASDLGAQNTPMNWLMNLGFGAFGVGVFLDARRLWWRAPFVAATFLCFGLSMAMNGVFPARPFGPNLPFSDIADMMHLVMAAFAAITFIVGAASFLFIEADNRRKRLCGAAAVWAMICVAAMLYWPDLQGLIQRLLALVALPWLAAFVPQGKGAAKDHPFLKP